MSKTALETLKLYLSPHNSYFRISINKQKIENFTRLIFLANNPQICANATQHTRNKKFIFSNFCYHFHLFHTFIVSDDFFLSLACSCFLSSYVCIYTLGCYMNFKTSEQNKQKIKTRMKESRINKPIQRNRFLQPSASNLLQCFFVTNKKSIILSFVVALETTNADRMH